MFLLARAKQLVFVLVVAGFWQCAAAQEPARDRPHDTRQRTAKSVEASGSETGLAAVYSDRLHGRKTASGQRYDRNKLTAAHKRLPFGTRVKITNLKNKKSVTARINDRGPTQAGRVLDISPAVAKRLGIRPKAMAEVRLDVVRTARAKPHKRRR